MLHYIYARLFWWLLSTLRHFTDFNTYNSGLGVPLAPIAKRGGQGGGAALVVQGCSSIVDGWVDWDCPHARSITVTVAVVIATAISWGPNVNAAFASASLKITIIIAGGNENMRLGNLGLFCPLQQRGTSNSFRTTVLDFNIQLELTQSSAWSVNKPEWKPITNKAAGSPNVWQESLDSLRHWKWYP